MIYGITGPVRSGKTRNMLRLLNDNYGNFASRPVYVVNAGSDAVDCYAESIHPDVHIGIPEGESLSTWHQWLPENGILIVEGAASALMMPEGNDHVSRHFARCGLLQSVFLIDTNLNRVFEQEPELKERILTVEVVALPYAHPWSDHQVLMSLGKGDPRHRARVLLDLAMRFIWEEPEGFIAHLLKTGFAGPQGYTVDLAREKVKELTLTHYLPLPDNCAVEFIYMADLLNKGERRAEDHRYYYSIIYQVLYAIADGSCRPGSWERGMLENMGLVADCPEHQVYRAEYGRPWNR